MIRHVWTILCGKSVTDPETQQTSLVDLLDEITILGPPPETMAALPVQYSLVSYWVRGPQDQGGRRRLRVDLRTPTGETLQGAPEGAEGHEVDLTMTTKGRAVMRFESLPLTQSGEYIFRIHSQADENEPYQLVAEVPLFVTFAPQPVEQSPTPPAPGGEEAAHP